VDCIDLSQIHWPNHSIPTPETIRSMAELVNASKVKYGRVSYFSTMKLREA